MPIDVSELNQKKQEMVTKLRERLPDIDILMAELQQAKRAGFPVDENIEKLKAEKERIQKVIRVYGTVS